MSEQEIKFTNEDRLTILAMGSVLLAQTMSKGGLKKQALEVSSEALMLSLEVLSEIHEEASDAGISPVFPPFNLPGN